MVMGMVIFVMVTTMMVVVMMMMLLDNAPPVETIFELQGGGAFFCDLHNMFLAIDVREVEPPLEGEASAEELPGEAWVPTETLLATVRKKLPLQVQGYWGR